MGTTITSSSTLTCPHGGTVTIASSNTSAKVTEIAAALSTDTFTVAGCPFQLPTTPPTPSPCVKVQWVVTDMQTTVNGTPTLSDASTGLCLSAQQAPQGSVTIVAGQARVQTR